MVRFLLWLFNGFVSTFGFTYLFYKLSDSKSKISLKIILCYLFGVISATLIEFFNLSVIGSFYFFVYFPFMFFLIKPMSLKRNFYYLMIIWIYAMILDIIIMLIVSTLYDLLNLRINENVDLASMLMTLFVSIILVVVANIKKLQFFTNNLYIKFCNIKYSSFSLIIFSAFTLFIALLMVFNLSYLKVNLLLVIIIFLVLIVFILLIKFKIIEDENTKFLKTLSENNEFYIKIDEENSIIKHNIKAQLLSIKSVSNNKAKSLIDDLILKFNKNTHISNKMKFIPYGLNGIIYEKIYPYVESLNIEIDNEINYDIFNVITPRKYNVLVEKMVIVLDNAIEASLKSNNKLLHINVYEDEENIIIRIINSFYDSVNIDEFGKKGYSTKGKKRGLGIFSAFRNTEANLRIKIINDKVICKIITKKRLM